ncbi:MAG: hypothetical protein JST12_15255 [Armatimonadetes bacterium]|nr:hypothetical protein [Armatimonadota bacterium]
MNVHYSIRSQWVSALRFCVFAIMPMGGLVHYLALRVWLAFAFSPIVLFSASLSLSQLGASLTEYQFSETKIKKIVLGRTVGVIRYDDIEKVKLRTDKWCYVKGNHQTFFLLPKMNGYDECIRLLGEKLGVEDQTKDA